MSKHSILFTGLLMGVLAAGAFSAWAVDPPSGLSGTSTFVAPAPAAPNPLPQIMGQDGGLCGNLYFDVGQCLRLDVNAQVSYQIGGFDLLNDGGVYVDGACSFYETNSDGGVGVYRDGGTFLLPVSMVHLYANQVENFCLGKKQSAIGVQITGTPVSGTGQFTAATRGPQ